MSHTRFALGFPRHAKVHALTDGAFRLWVSALDRARENGGDGELSPLDLDVIAKCPKAGRKRDALVGELVVMGLWERREGGWQIHDYLEWQDSSQQVVKRRERARQHMRAVRGAAKANSVADVSFAVSANKYDLCATDGSLSSSPSGVSNPVSSPISDLPGSFSQPSELPARPRPRPALMAVRVEARVYEPLDEHWAYAVALGLTQGEYDSALRDLRDKFGGKKHDEPWLDDKFSAFLEQVARSKQAGPRRADGGAETSHDRRVRAQAERAARLEAEEAAS